MASADGRAKTMLRHGRAWRVSLDAILAMPIPPHGLRWLGILSKPRAITDGGMLVLSRGELSAIAPIVVAGVGTGLLREVARRLSRDYVDFDTLIDVSPDIRTMVSSVAPAASVAILGSGPRISLIIKWRRKPGDRLLLAVPRRRYDVR